MKIRGNKIYLFAVLFGIMYSLSFVDSKHTCDVFETINRLEFVEYDFDKIYMHSFLIWYFHIVAFQIVYGTYIYRRFCTASVYYFSRMNNRVRWFIKESIKLYLACIIYLFIIALLCCLSGSSFSGLWSDKSTLIIFCYHICVQSLWLLATTLLVNVLSILFGSSISFSIIYFIQVAFLSLFAIFEKYFRFEQGNIGRKTLILKSNPISHLVLKWHSSSMREINQKINYLHIDFDLWESIMFYLIMSAIVIIFGSFVVKKQELIYLNRETGGAE